MKIHHLPDDKSQALKKQNLLYPKASKITDELFQTLTFFDPRDLVQVKYEMLRRVSVENVLVTDATEDYGVSRPTYYQAKANLAEAGIAGLVPKKRGPHGPHKLHGEVLRFVENQVTPGEPIRARQLTTLIRQKFNLQVQPRTIERALGVKKLQGEA